MFLLTTAIIAAGATAQQQAAPAPTAAPAPHPLPAGANEPLAEGEGRAVAEKLAGELELNFVYPEQAKRYSAMLRSNLATGRYDLGSRIDLARKLTDDLQAVEKDGHLRIELRGPERERGGGGGPPNGSPPLIQSAREIAPGVAYIRFTAFMGTD
ncbi:MAG TPA: hypothetical protein VEB39_03185, partial [Sphingomicrobium sp.]|nr:hypothetical protein [Sphingomicrobium sp.]